MNLLVIAYYFPPFPRVGGRRWAKFVKYLNRKKINTYVLAGDYEGSSAWDNDIIEYKDKIYRIPLTEATIPYFKRKLPDNGFQKILWKLDYYYWTHIKSRRLNLRLQDQSEKDITSFYNKAVEIIKEKSIDKIILTVGPFHYSAVIIKLKEIFPKIEIVLDYRDLWNDELTTIRDTSRIHDNEMKLEKEVVNSSDLLIVTEEHFAKDMGVRFKEKNIGVIAHAFDIDDFEGLDLNKEEYNLDRITFIYGGELYPKLENEVLLFCELCKELSLRCNSKIVFKLFSSRNDYKLIFKEYEEYLIVKYSKTIAKEQFYSQVLNADFVLIFRPSWSDALSSKFYDLVYFQKPIIYFGNEGVVEEFIKKYNIGIHVTKENIKSITIDKLKSMSLIDRIELIKYNFQSRTEKLIDLLEVYN